MSLSDVKVYNENGYVKDLPSMRRKRRDHACGYFRNSNHNLVFFSLKTLNFPAIFLTGVSCYWRFGLASIP